MSVWEIKDGDCLYVMAGMEAESIDAIVCDPPYGLSFMGKSWDHGVPGVPFWEAALRVAKPGAHLLAFGGTRTFHRLTCAIEDAGWEIRDCLSWLYGSGFPKSLNVARAIDIERGIRAPEPELVSDNRAMTGVIPARHSPWEPTTETAKKWNGWGTALKPSWEPIILARKPLKGTVATNVQAQGTGAINVDGCRIGGGEKRFLAPAGNTGDSPASVAPVNVTGYAGQETLLGRWPANTLLDEEAAALLDKQSGAVGGGDGTPSFVKGIGGIGTGAYAGGGRGAEVRISADFGGASRFFYVAKPARSEREEGIPKTRSTEGADSGALRDGGRGTTARIVNRNTPPGSKGSKSPRAGATSTRPVFNFHPTVKPVELMQWLCRLVTPPNGLVLDPFCGSGSTGCAAVFEGFRFIGIEKEPEYAEIARSRITHWELRHQPDLFSGDAA